MITVVTAPGRSGTSLTMQMLQAAGIPLCWNRLPNRTAINPHGHYELDRYVWDAEYAAHILPQCENKAVKIFPRNLTMLTPDHDYRFITILREPTCVRDSQVVMLEKEYRSHEKPEPDSHLAAITRQHTRLTEFLLDYPHCTVWFNQLFNGEAQDAIGSFLGFDDLRIAKMRDCVEPSLWHFRPEAYDTQRT